MLTSRQSFAAFAMVGFASCGIAGLSSATQNSLKLPEASPEQTTFFETKIRPILANQCVRCHGPNMQMAGIRLDSAQNVAKGGDHGALLLGGDPDRSRLIQVVRYAGPVKMPPGAPLKKSEIADLEAWVKMGAPWPAGDKPKANQGTALWSLLPVKHPPTPAVKNRAWVKNPIDAFILANLERRHLTPAIPADRRTLIRRVTYDLIGLPPTPEETDAFLKDKTPNAYARVVDRLLSSPHYGERWGRMWLDVARYADTKGYVFEEDRNYPTAYTYRNWVIDAFNRDLPYDRFLIRQLAADRLPDVQASDDKSDLAAMGYLTLGRRFLNSAPDIIDDRIDVTMRGMQGFTVACARCHDHKFDPIPTQDYYSLYAVFASSEERTVPVSKQSLNQPWEQYNARVAGNEAEIGNLVLDQIRILRTKLKDAPQTLSDEVKGTLQGLREDQMPDPGRLAKLAPAFEAGERNHLSQLQRDLETLRKSPPPTPELALTLVDRPNPGDGVVFRRGNPGNPGDPAPRRFLKALCPSNAEREHWINGSGRLELAKAIASKNNPLTARVFVNRVWQGHFGAGLVRTPSDFGHQGEKPTHPELLDWLASDFMDHGWSIKKLHRLIVTSSTYCQSADVSAAGYNADPENRTWNRMNRRRLDLEQMRDSLMMAAGRLDLRDIGGHSVDLWSTPYTPRRAVYGFIERQNLPGIFKTFDFASPDATSARRFNTTVPQQALFFLNSSFAVDEAKALAERPEIKAATDDGQRVRRLYRTLFDRLPDADELKVGVAFLKQPAPQPAIPVWQYGFGAYDPDERRVSGFTSLGHYADNGYRVSPSFPDPALGYLVLNSAGGHPGHDGAHAVVRRWIAPVAATVQISGMLGHPSKEGDGVRGRIVSSRTGLLGEWSVHHGQAATNIAAASVQPGDRIDFIVDPLGSDAYDAFAWAPVLRSTDGKGSWSATTDFGPPPPAALSRVALYAQALLMTNEFMFVD